MDANPDANQCLIDGAVEQKPRPSTVHGYSLFGSVSARFGAGIGHPDNIAHAITQNINRRPAERRGIDLIDDLQQSSEFPVFCFSVLKKGRFLRAPLYLG